MAKSPSKFAQTAKSVGSGTLSFAGAVLTAFLDQSAEVERRRISDGIVNQTITSDELYDYATRLRSYERVNQS